MVLFILSYKSSKGSQKSSLTTLKQ